LSLSDALGMHARPVAGGTDMGEDQPNGTWTRDGRYYVFAAGSVTRHDLWATMGGGGVLGSFRHRPERLTNGPLDWTWPSPGLTAGNLFALGELGRGELVSLGPGTTEWRSYLG